MAGMMRQKHRQRQSTAAPEIPNSLPAKWPGMAAFRQFAITNFINITSWFCVYMWVAIEIVKSGNVSTLGFIKEE